MSVPVCMRHMPQHMPDIRASTMNTLNTMQLRSHETVSYEREKAGLLTEEIVRGQWRLVHAEV